MDSNSDGQADEARPTSHPAGEITEVEPATPPDHPLTAPPPEPVEPAKLNGGGSETPEPGPTAWTTPTAPPPTAPAPPTASAPLPAAVPGAPLTWSPAPAAGPGLGTARSILDVNAYYATPGRPYRPSAPMSVAARGALAVAGLVALATTIHYIAGMAFQGRINTAGADASEIDAFNGLSAQLGVLSGAVSLVSAIVFLRWLWRSVLNAPILGAAAGIVDSRGAVTAWLVPIRNFWKPYLVVMDLHDRLLAPLHSRSGRWLIRIWWVSWLLGTVVGEFILLSRPSTVSGGSDRVVFMSLLAVSSAISVAGAVLAITVVTQLERLARARECACLGDPNRAITLVDASQRRRVTALPFAVAIVALVALLVPIGITAADAAKPVAWSAFTAPDGSFTVDMPSTPTAQSQSTTGVELRSYRSGINAQIAFIAGYADYPAGTISQMSKSTVFYNMERGIGSSANLTSREISIDGNPGREWSGSVASREVKMRVYLVGDRAYIVEVEYTRSMAGSSDIDRFLDSFKLD